jgi:hypothetical protein
MIKIQLFDIEPAKLTIDMVSTKLQSIRHVRRELAIQPYTSKRRMHIDAAKDQERAHMQFAVMEAIQVIKPMNAPTTTKTATRLRPSHSLNSPTL